MILTRFLPRLRLPVIAVMLIAATFNSARSQYVLEPSSPELRSLVHSLLEGRCGEALEVGQRLVKEDAENAAAWYFLGVVHVQRRDFENASDAFEKAIKIQPDLAAEVRSRFASSLVLRNRLRTAEEAARKALEADPKTTLALYTLGLVALRNRARDEALKNADAVIALKPDFAEAYLLKSEALMIPTAGDRSSNPEEARRNQQLHYREAATALDAYVRLISDPEKARFWSEQLKTLEVYASDESAEIRSLQEVTTKIRLVSKPEPTYTEDARKEGIQGTVILRCVFAVDGTIQHVLILQSLPGGLTEMSMKAARSIKFEPAMIDGRPVSTYLQLEYNFAVY